MQADVFNADEVVAGRQALGDREADGCDVCGATRGPGYGRGKRVGLVSVDFEPHRAGTIPGSEIGACGGFGHVDLQGTWVVDVGRDGEAEGGAGGDGGGVCGDRAAAYVAPGRL